MAWRIGVDSGGTFTDICLFDEKSERIAVWKVSSTAADPSLAVAEGLGEALGEPQLRLEQRKGWTAPDV
jgi:N-methylhydantoinase A